MQLAKAIELLGALASVGEVEVDWDDANAVKLGIEALKRVLNTRVEPRYSSVDPLPGEAEGVSDESH